MSTCPTDYCREDVTDIDLRVPDQLCAEGRTGTLCGACREGLSSVFGTAECQKRSNAFLAIILLLALLGIVIIVSGLILNLTCPWFFDGTLEASNPTHLCDPYFPRLSHHSPLHSTLCGLLYLLHLHPVKGEFNSTQCLCRCKSSSS